MQDYDVVVGGRTNAGQNYLNDFHTTGTVRPILDTQQNYTLEGASEENGITSLRFRRPRVTNDTRDIQFNVSTRVFLVWAYHTREDADNPNVFSQHTRRNHTMETVQIVFPPMNMTMMTPTPEPATTRVTTRPKSSGYQLGVSFLTISVATVLSMKLN
ncbi:DBH-like monooxygenase protein 1 [Desmophyllum pertusum]|uniref:DBH-like monooxygenase protein 1 n=1 Tax=Desmophyllum pertusum TaxID=174260 RepID=A0A9W9ZIT0_9CNID|nr:DBH-like monooxygenase protein 1 [Desmophyllum pertusum]